MSRRPQVLAFTVAATWGLCFVFIQASLPSPAPLFLAGLRAVIGGAMLLAWMVAGLARRHRARDAGPSRPRVPGTRLLVHLAMTNAVLAFGAMYLAAGRTETAVASILTGAQPVLLAIAGWVLFRERASVRSVVGVLLAIGGVVVVAAAAGGNATLDGVGLAAVATVAPALGTITMRRIGPAVDLVATTSLQFLLGGAILLGVSAVTEPWTAIAWTPSAIDGLLFLGIAGTGISYLGWFALLREVPLLDLGVALFTVPVVGVVAAMLAGDRPGPVVLAGVGALLAGILLVGLRPTGSRPDDRLEGDAVSELP